MIKIEMNPIFMSWVIVKGLGYMKNLKILVAPSLFCLF